MPEPREQKGKPEAVNLARDEPISTAARRRVALPSEREEGRADERADPR